MVTIFHEGRAHSVGRKPAMLTIRAPRNPETVIRRALRRKSSLSRTMLAAWLLGQFCGAAFAFLTGFLLGLLTGCLLGLLTVGLFDAFSLLF